MPRKCLLTAIASPFDQDDEKKYRKEVFMLFITAPLAVLAVSIIWQIIYNLFLSPLRSVPGPLIARISPQWLTLADLRGNRTTTIHRLHQKYGRSVRIGPNEISYSNTEVVKELYGQQTTFLKARSYEDFVVHPVGIFSMRDKAAHSQRRRLLSHAFSQSNILDTEPIITQVMSRLLNRIRDCQGKPVDVLYWFRLTAFDIVGELFLGRPATALVTLQLPTLLHDIDQWFLLGRIRAAYPWLGQILSVLPIRAVQQQHTAEDRIIQFGREAFNTYVSKYGRDSGRRDLLTKIIGHKEEVQEAPMSDMEIHVEIADLVFAGTDTTSTTLTYLFWELAKHPEWQIKLRAELLEKLGPNRDDLPLFKDVSELPLLGAVIHEALRMHPAAPASLPRETPHGGHLLNGVHVPEKTVVSMQCYTTHRDPVIFPNPNSFTPERWQKPPTATRVTGPTSEEAAKLLFMPFSAGPRVCLGQNLAIMELRLLTSVLLRHFNVQLAPGTTEDSMSMTDHFLTIPKAGKCELVFTKV